MTSRDPARTATPFARSCATMRRPVAPVAPTTSTGPSPTPESAAASARPTGRPIEKMPEVLTRAEKRATLLIASRRPSVGSSSDDSSLAALHLTDGRILRTSRVGARREGPDRAPPRLRAARRVAGACTARTHMLAIAEWTHRVARAQKTMNGRPHPFGARKGDPVSETRVFPS